MAVNHEVGNTVMVEMFRFKHKKTGPFPRFSFRTVRRVCIIRQIDPDGSLFYVLPTRDRSLGSQWVTRSQIKV